MAVCPPCLRHEMDESLQFNFFMHSVFATVYKTHMLKTSVCFMGLFALELGHLFGSPAALCHFGKVVLRGFKTPAFVLVKFSFVILFLNLEFCPGGFPLSAPLLAALSLMEECKAYYPDPPGGLCSEESSATFKRIPWLMCWWKEASHFLLI